MKTNNKTETRQCDKTLEELLILANELNQYFLDNFRGNWDMYDKVNELKSKAIDLKLHAYISGLNKE